MQDVRMPVGYQNKPVSKIFTQEDQIIWKSIHIEYELAYLSNMDR